MATANAAATLERANDWSTDFTTASMIIKDGAVTLATHTLAGFVTSNSGSDGVSTANAIADATIAADGTADTAEITAGTKTYTLVVGVDITLSTTTYITGETSSINSLVVTFPA